MGPSAFARLASGPNEPEQQPLPSTLAAGLLLLKAGRARGSPAGSIPLSRDRAAGAQGGRWMLLE